MSPAASKYARSPIATVSSAGQARSVRVYGQSSSCSVVGVPPGVGSGSTGSSVAGAPPSSVVSPPSTAAKFAGSSASENEVGVSSSGRSSWACTARSASAYASGKTSFGISESRCSHAVADGGALDPSTRIEAMMRGSMPMATRRPARASSWRVRSPVGPVQFSSREGSMRPAGSPVVGVVSGAASATATEPAAGTSAFA